MKPVNWAPLIARSIHEVKVGIMEALDWIGQPLSAKEFWLMFGARNYEYEAIAFHVKALATVGVIEEVDRRQVRGAQEKYYLRASSS